MPLIDLPPGAAELLAHWQVALGPQDINDNLVNDTRTLLSTLVSAQDQQPTMDTLRTETIRLNQELLQIQDELEVSEAAVNQLRSELS
jgi:hypothetical protein